MTKPRFTLNDSKPQTLEAKSSVLTILVLGTLDLEHIESLSVTLKLSKTGKQSPPIRVSLDLYRDQAVEDLINNICKKFETGFSDTQSLIYELIEQLESYRFRLIENKKPFSESVKLSPQATQSSKRYLGKQNVIELIKEDLQKAGVHSHVNEALLLFIAIASRQVKHPLSLCFLDDSNLSNQLFEVLTQSLPKSSYIYPSSISSQALYYLSTEECKHKSIFLTDFENKQEIHQPIAQLIKDNKLMKLVALKDKSGLPYTMNPEVRGPINLNAIASYKGEHKLKAMPLLKLPIQASPQALEQWNYAHKMESAGLICRAEQEEARQRLLQLQSILKPIKVINPYAIHIDLPTQHKGNSQLVEQTLKLIACISYLNQFKRPHYVQDLFNKPTAPYIKTELEDIALAFELLRPILDRKEGLLNQATQSFYDWLCVWTKAQGLETFYPFQIRQEQQMLKQRSLNRYLKDLVQTGYIEITGGKKHTGYSYRIRVDKSKEKEASESSSPSTKSSYDTYIKTLMSILNSV